MTTYHRSVNGKTLRLGPQERWWWRNAMGLLGGCLFLVGSWGGWARAETSVDDAVPAQAEQLNQKVPRDDVLDEAKRTIVPAQATLLYGQMMQLMEAKAYAQAESLGKEALAIHERVLGAKHRDVAMSLRGLGQLYYAQGRYGEAEPLFQRALALYEQLPDATSLDVASSLSVLATLYYAQERYGEAEILFQRNLALAERLRDAAHSEAATLLNTLAAPSQTQDGETEALFQRTVALLHPLLEAIRLDEFMSTSLNGLGLLYQEQGRYEDAERLLQRALTLEEQSRDGTMPALVAHVHKMFVLQQAQDGDAELQSQPVLVAMAQVLRVLSQSVLSAVEYVSGAHQSAVAKSLNNLAILYHAQRRYEDAEPLFQRSIAMEEQRWGSSHPNIAVNLNNLAVFYDMQGRYREAKPLYQRALALLEQSSGPFHFMVASIHNSLAEMYKAQGEIPAALALARRATEIVRRQMHERDTLCPREQEASLTSERPRFVQHVTLLAQNLLRDTKPHPALTAEAFDIGQLAQTNTTAVTVARMTSRFWTDSRAFATLIRTYQDTCAWYHVLDAQLTRLRGGELSPQRDAEVAQVRGDRETRNTQMQEIETQLTRDFPRDFARYTELVQPQPTALSTIQALLAPTEALLFYLVSDKQTFLWVVRATQATWQPLDLGRADLTTRVTALRHTLNPQTFIPFASHEAHALYQHLVAPAAPFLEGVTHLLIVPDGPLTSLPFSVLLREPPSPPPQPLPSDPFQGITWLDGSATAETHPDYRQMAWLAQQYAMTVLPSVSTLALLRGPEARPTQAPLPFVGIGDPLLHGDCQPPVPFVLAAAQHTGTPSRGETPGAAPAWPRPTEILLRSAQGRADKVRTLERLCDTATELQTLARTLGADPETHVYLRERATKPQVRSLALQHYRIIAFATHGLLPQETTQLLPTEADRLRGMARPVRAMAEPALVLTPPATASEEDDGLLLASDITGLTLDADWVILSACNTAAGGTPGGEGLSGLAKAFFYAGARALLVSHWPVASEAATFLTTTLFRRLAQQPALGRATALQQAMLAWLQEAPTVERAHPVYWAPFVVVGQGSALQ